MAKRGDQRDGSDAMAAGLACSQSSSFQPIPSVQHPVPQVTGMHRQRLGVIPPQCAPSPPQLKNRHPALGN